MRELVLLSVLMVELIYHISIVYKGWIDSKFTLVHKGVLVTTQGCTKDSEQCFLVRLINSFMVLGG